MPVSPASSKASCAADCAGGSPGTALPRGITQRLVSRDVMSRNRGSPSAAMSYARTPYFSIIQPVSDCHQTVTIGPVPEIRIECKASCRRCSLDPRAVKFELRDFRSEEHTSELQSLMRISYAVFCLKKK